MKSSFVVLVVLLSKLFALGADPEPYLKSAPMPFYPPLCRTARIRGTVTVHFTVNENGDTSDIEADGPKLLREAVVQDLKDWKFGWAQPCSCHVKKEVLFVYKISDKWVDDEGPTSLVRWFGKSPVTRVEIEAGGRTVQP